MDAVREFFAPLMHPIGAIGLLGQCMFFSRFLLQWVVSEKKGRSTIPIGFWYLSLAGGILLLIYVLWRRDPVLTVGQSVGIFVYSRNLVLIYRERRQAK
jgi:lipid-A-disaccharide synthase-like uncharacterized protein